MMYATILLLIVLIHSKISKLSSCRPPGASDKVQVGFDTYVCVTVGPLSWSFNSNTTGTYVRTSSKVIADDLASIKIKDSWTSVDYQNDTLLRRVGVRNAFGEGLAVSVESMGIISYQKLYRGVESDSVNTTVTYPVFMAIIGVDQGKVQSITWDDNCKWCSASECAGNTYDYFGNIAPNTRDSCFVRDGDCVYGYNGTSIVPSALCELKVYITWTGTDSKGYFFNSAASRFSRLGRTQLKDYSSRLLNKPVVNE